MFFDCAYRNWVMNDYDVWAMLTCLVLVQLLVYVENTENSNLQDEEKSSLGDGGYKQDEDRNDGDDDDDDDDMAKDQVEKLSSMGFEKARAKSVLKRVGNDFDRFVWIKKRICPWECRASQDKA